MDGLIEQMKQLVNEFDFANFIPEVDSILGWVETLVRIFVMAAPICILVFGLFFLFLPPKEANHRAGYRTYFGMGSVEAWRFTQQLAGIVWSGYAAGVQRIPGYGNDGYGKQRRRLRAVGDRQHRCLLLGHQHHHARGV